MHPPFFPLLLAGLHGILGDPVPHGIVRGILGVASAAVPVLLYLLLRDLVDRRAALAAGLLATFSFGLDVLGTSATSEGLFLLTVLGLLVAVRAHPRGGRPGIRRGLLVGALGGALALTRAEGILLALLCPLLWLATVPRRDVRSLVATAAAVLAGLLLVLAPWTIRNAGSLTRWNREVGKRIGVELPTFVPVTAYGPLNFALANNAAATGGFQRDLLTSGDRIPILNLADPQHRHYFLHGTTEGWNWIRRNRASFGSLVARKLAITVRALDLGWSPWNLPHGRTGTRGAVDLFAPDRGGLRWFQLALAGIGLVLLLRRPGGGRAALLLAAPVLTVLASGILFFGYVRLGMLAAPLLFAWEGIALARVAMALPAGFRARAGRPIVGWTLAGVALALLLYAATEDRNYVASGSTDRPGGLLHRDAPIRIEPATSTGSQAPPVPPERDRDRRGTP